MNSQNQDVLRHLQRGERITNKVAFNKYAITRLSARIYDLRQKGHPIYSEPVKRRSKRTGRLIRYLSYYMK